MIGGKVGAMIGATTASKVTKTTIGTSHIEHKYTLSITVNNLSKPIEKIYLGKKEGYAKTAM